MSRVDWSEMYTKQDVDVAYSFLEEKILEILDTMAPMKTTQPRNKRSDWISPSTKELMKQRDRVRTRAVASSQQADWEHYKTLKNKCNSQVKKDRRGHFKSIHETILEKNDTKALYKLMKKQMGWKSAGTPVAFHADGSITRKPNQHCKHAN